MPARSRADDTTAAYDASAQAYADLVGTTITAAVEGPVDRALLAAFVEIVGDGSGTVADIGCGNGRVASFLAERGIGVLGVDPSEGMLAVARRAHPTLHFESGSTTAVPCGDASLIGAVCWYSIIHTPAAGLRAVAAELRRVLRPGSPLLVAFQAGHGETIVRHDVAGSGVSLTNERHDPEVVAGTFTAAGFREHSRTVRSAVAEHENSDQAFFVFQVSD